MPIFQLITVALGMSFFVVSLVMLYRVRQLTVIRGLQGWWAFLGLLVLFFMAGYAAFFVFLLQGTAPSFDINLMISLIFFGDRTRTAFFTGCSAAGCCSRTSAAAAFLGRPPLAPADLQ